MAAEPFSTSLAKEKAFSISKAKVDYVIHDKDDAATNQFFAIKFKDISQRKLPVNFGGISICTAMIAVNTELGDCLFIHHVSGTSFKFEKHPVYKKIQSEGINYEFFIVDLSNKFDAKSFEQTFSPHIKSYTYLNRDELASALEEDPRNFASGWDGEEESPFFNVFFNPVNGALNIQAGGQYWYTETICIDIARLFGDMYTNTAHKEVSSPSIAHNQGVTFWQNSSNPVGRQDTEASAMQIGHTRTLSS